MHEGIARLFEERGVLYRREVVLSDRDRIDFMLENGVGIEVKIKATKRLIYRQCERYCEHESVHSLILVSGTAMGFPREINGKPCWVASLGSGWL